MNFFKIYYSVKNEKGELVCTGDRSEWFDSYFEAKAAAANEAKKMYNTLAEKGLVKNAAQFGKKQDEFSRYRRRHINFHAQILKG